MSILLLRYISYGRLSGRLSSVCLGGRRRFLQGARKTGRVKDANAVGGPVLGHRTRRSAALRQQRWRNCAPPAQRQAPTVPFSRRYSVWRLLSPLNLMALHYVFKASLHWFRTRSCSRMYCVVRRLRYVSLFSRTFLRDEQAKPVPAGKTALKFLFCSSSLSSFFSMAGVLYVCGRLLFILKGLLRRQTLCLPTVSFSPSVCCYIASSLTTLNCLRRFEDGGRRV